jgi:hypothetical protein
MTMNFFFINFTLSQNESLSADGTVKSRSPPPRPTALVVADFSRMHKRRTIALTIAHVSAMSGGIVVYFHNGGLNVYPCFEFEM